MAVPRILVTTNAIEGARIELAGEAFHHLSVVLRRGVGERFWAVDPQTGTEYLAEITRLGDSALTGQVLEQAEARSQPAVELTLYQGLPKGRRFPLILQKCTELGVSRIVPVVTARTVVQLDGKRAASKLQRWGKIVAEASRQSMRPIPPEVTEPVEFGEALADWQASGGLGLFCDEGLAGEDSAGLGQMLAKLELPQRLGAFIGPEGGFTQDEAEMAVAAGLVAVGLGDRILRTETAAITVCAIVMYECGELG